MGIEPTNKGFADLRAALKTNRVSLCGPPARPVPLIRTDRDLSLELNRGVPCWIRRTTAGTEVCNYSVSLQSIYLSTVQPPPLAIQIAD